MKVFIPLICFVFLCSSGPSQDENLSGKWTMFKVIQYGKDVSPTHNPFNERYIIFNANGAFESGGRPFGENGGKYEYNPTDHTLFLDSDVGPEDDSKWKVTFNGDTMHWRGIGSEWAENFELIHLKD